MLLFERARGREEIFSLVFEEGRSIPSCKVVFYSFYGINYVINQFVFLTVRDLLAQHAAAPKMTMEWDTDVDTN